MKSVLTLGRNLDCGQTAAENRAAELLHSFVLKGREVGDLADVPHGPADPPSKIRGPADLVNVLATRLEQIDAAELSTVERTRLTASLTDVLLRVLTVDVLEKRLEAVENVLKGRKEKVKQ
jgi:hypothetical protein